MNFPCCTVWINAAQIPCGDQKAAFYFFVSSAGALSESWAFAALPLAFAEEEEVGGHSLTVCPTLQKRHELFAN